jgi:hypothetical protein
VSAAKHTFTAPEDDYVEELDQMMCYRRRIRAVDEALTERITTAHSRLYNHRIDVDAAFARFQQGCPPGAARHPRTGRHRPARPRRLAMAWAACAGAVAVTGIVTFLSVRQPASAPSVAVQQPVTSTTDSHGAARPAPAMARLPRPASPPPNDMPTAIRGGRTVSTHTYPLKSGASQLTATLLPASDGTVCYWWLTAGDRPAQPFTVTSTPRPVQMELATARTFTVQAPPGDCTMTGVHVATTTAAQARSDQALLASPSSSAAAAQPASEPATASSPDPPTPTPTASPTP